MSRRSRLVLLLSLLPLPLAAATPVGDPAAGRAPTGAVRVIIETVGIDRRGTWSLGTDIADLFSGSTGVLHKSATLVSRDRASEAREMIEMTARLTPTLRKEGGCALGLETETRTVVAGAKAGAKPSRPDRVRASLVLKPAEERLVDAYVSSTTQGRVAMKLRCEAPPAAATVVSESDLRFVDFVLSMSRGDGDDEPLALKSNGLRAVVGREASDLFSFNVPLEPDASGGKRYRREKLEVTLMPTMVSGGKVQIVLGVRGEMATVAAGVPPVVHPIEREETVVVAPGEKHDVDIDVRSDGPDEGWGRVRYRVSIAGSF